MVLPLGAPWEPSRLPRYDDDALSRALARWVAFSIRHGVAVVAVIVGLSCIAGIASYRWLPGYAVALLTVLTPLYVVVLDDREGGEMVFVGRGVSELPVAITVDTPRLRSIGSSSVP